MKNDIHKNAVATLMAKAHLIEELSAMFDRAVNDETDLYTEATRQLEVGQEWNAQYAEAQAREAHARAKYLESIINELL